MFSLSIIRINNDLDNYHLFTANWKFIFFVINAIDVIFSKIIPKSSVYK